MKIKKCTGHSGSFFSVTLKIITHAGRDWFATYPQEPSVVWLSRLVLTFLFPFAVNCYLCSLWFSDWMHRLKTPHGWKIWKWMEDFASVYSGPDFWWLSRITKESLILSSDLQSYRCPPDAAGSLHCPLHVIQWRRNIHFGAKGWNCFHGVRIKCNLVVHHRK